MRHRADERRVNLPRARRPISGSGMWRRLVAAKTFALVLLLAASLGTPAVAQTIKRVGIVFDDSGSMQGRSHLPVFGIQMIAGSLTRNDALFGLTFSHHLGGGRPIEIRLGSDTEQQAAIDRLRQWADNLRANTPYEPVEAMLRHLASTARAGEDVHMFVFTDGGFNRPPPVADIERRYQQLRQQIVDQRNVAGFKVHFIAFAPDAGEEAIIRGQRVAATLGNVFNGGENEGIHYVKSFDQLREVLVSIVAAIADTEPDAKAHAVVRNGPKITVTPPFTVTRIVVVTTAPFGQATPRVIGWPHKDRKKSPPRELTAFMARADTVAKAGVGADTRWQAAISHLDYLPALEAGVPFELEFDQAVDQRTSILFRSDVKLEWDVFDAAGQKVPPGQDGTVTIGADQEYEIRARVEQKDTRNPIATFDHLPSDTEFFYIPGGQARQVMQINRKSSYAFYKLRERQPGMRTASVSIRTPGFVTQRSRELRIRIEETNFRPDLQAEPLIQCPNCSPAGIEARLTPGDAFRPAMKVSARFASPDPSRRGEVEFKLQEALPPGVRVQLPGGNGVLEGTRTSYVAAVSGNDAIDLVFEIDGRLLDKLPDGHRVLISANARSPLRGSGSLNFRLLPLPEQARLVPSGTTDGGVGDTQFRARPEGLDGRAGFYIKVEKAYGKPEPSNFQVQIAGLKHAVVLQPQGDIILVKPLPAWWFKCCVLPGEYQVDVRFSNQHRQEATLARTMVVEEVTWLERLMICLTLLLGVIAIIWTLAALWRLATSHRFPSRARLKVYLTGQAADAEFRRLARRPWPWLRPFLWPWSGTFDETRVISGMRLQAMQGGVRVLPKTGAYSSLHRGAEYRPLAELFKGGLEAVEIFWQEKLVDKGPDRTTYEFVDRQGA